MSSDQIEEMTRAPADLGKDRCAIALRKALARSGRFATVRELANASGINYNTIKKYFQGRHLPSVETWRHLADVLGQRATPISDKTDPSGTGSTLARHEPSEHATRVWETIKRLSQQLEFFKKGSKNDRDVLRKAIPGRDVGYVTSLLRALYDEDQFDAWILFSEYSMRSRKDEGTSDR